MLRESKGNMYSWVTHTKNFIKGKCSHGCSYCYMKKYNLKSPRLDEKEFTDDLGSDKIIFVGSSCDMFANNIPDEWIYRILYHVHSYNNLYLFQSKNPNRMINWADDGFNLAMDRICTTIETNRWYSEFMQNTPKSRERALAMSKLKFNRYLTIEPIMDFDLYEMIELVQLCNPTQVNIGADSGNNHLPEPSKEKILTLINELQKFTIIDQKINLQRLLRNN